jgi:hypothetical protein
MPTYVDEYSGTWEIEDEDDLQFDWQVQRQSVHSRAAGGEFMDTNLAQLLNDPSTPYWAKEVIVTIKDQDPIDVCKTLTAIVEAIEMDLDKVAAELLRTVAT